jgi:chitinase
MAYDFHGKWESQTGHNSPLYAPSSDSNWRKQLCVDYSANMWVRMGAPREKLIIGTGTYGRSFKLADINKNEVNSASTGGGIAGQYTKEEGVLAYYEVCEMLKDPATIYVWDNEMQVPFCYKDDQWVGFDDERSIKNKMQWIKDNGFGGAMVWTVDFDDFHGICGNGNYPLISIITQELLGIPRPQGNKITDWSEGKPKHRKPTNNDIATTQPDGEPQLVKEQELTALQRELAGAKIICYFTTWSSKRSGKGKFLPADIDTSLCTHVVIAFATVKDGKLAAPNEIDQSLYDSVIDLKKKKLSLKVLLAVGGWNFGSKPFRDLTGSSFKRNIFVYDAVDYLRKHSFDGLDVDWEYPRGNDEKERYALLLKELREAFDGEANANKVPPLLLSAAVPANFEVLSNGYDVAEISKHLDLINVMTYDFHGLWETQIGHNSPLKPMTASSEYLSKLTTDYSTREWIRLGAPKEKLMIGMATYGRSFTLEDTKKFDIGDSAIGGGRQGKFTKESGILAFYEICDFLRANATLVWDEEQGVPFAYKGNQWVGFDDERSITGKMEWLKSNELGGVMVWSVDLDDFTGYCGGPSYPLLTMINKQLQNYTVPGVVLQQVASQVKKVTIEEIVCKEEDGVITYHQDKRDCTKYYMCEGDRRHHMPCPVNLVFNINQNVCDWPENVDGCGKSR